jgi:hypothetical protein
VSHHAILQWLLTEGDLELPEFQFLEVLVQEVGERQNWYIF